MRVRAAGTPLVGLAAAALALAACDPERPPRIGAVVLQEAWCSRPGLPSPLRQTVVVIDDRAVRRVENPSEFRTANADLFRLVSSLGGVSDAVRGGLLAPRERVSVLLAPVDGAAPRLLFSGCAPALSAAEFEAARAQRGGVGNFGDDMTGGGIASDLSTAQEQFDNSLVGTVARLGGGAPPAAITEPLAGSSLVRSLKSTGRLVDPAHGLSRIFVVARRDLFAAAGDGVAARREGFAAGRAAGLNLGQAEVHVIGERSGNGDAARETAHAFLLVSGASLGSWGGDFNGLPGAPARVETFNGHIAYPPSRVPMSIRLAADAQGRLVNSWLALSEGPDRLDVATPITGRMTCAGSDRCTVTSDAGGLAQAWSSDPDAEAEWSPDLPLGGLRSLEATLTGPRLEGRVFDPGVGQIGEAPGTTFLPFSLTRTSGGPQ